MNKKEYPTYRACGLCGIRVRFVGSHVVQNHAESLASSPAITDARYNERMARLITLSRGAEII